MERNSLKDHSIGSRACSSNKLKYSWNLNHQSCEEDHLGGFSWPSRSYTCSFCKREFKSAQARGGHMNVHRRDRAGLRQSPPMDDDSILNINPNPTTVSPPLTSTLSSSAPPPIAALSSPAFASSSEINKWAIDDTPLSTKTFDRTINKTRKSFFDAEGIEGCTREDGYKFLKKAEIVRLDLEIGLFSDPKEDLDLELRLGYS